MKRIIKKLVPVLNLINLKMNKVYSCRVITVYNGKNRARYVC